MIKNDVLTAQEIIEKLQLLPHPEGGYYKETYRSALELNSPQNDEVRNAMTDIYFLLCKGQVSRLHKVLHEELWNFYAGAPLELIELDAETLEEKIVVLGQGLNFKHCIQANNWQAARSTGDYTLVGCTVAPGFDFADFSFLSDTEVLTEKLSAKSPELIKFI